MIIILDNYTRPTVISKALKYEASLIALKISEDEFEIIKYILISIQD